MSIRESQIVDTNCRQSFDNRIRAKKGERNCAKNNEVHDSIYLYFKLLLSCLGVEIFEIFRPKID